MKETLSSGIESLAIAVIMRAVRDEANAVSYLRRSKKDAMKQQQAEQLQNDCENFFRNEYYMYSGIIDSDLDGETVRQYAVRHRSKFKDDDDIALGFADIVSA